MKFLSIFLFLIISFVSFDANAQIEKISAVVNDDIISESELNDRIVLVISSSGLTNNSEMRKKFRSQILGDLIDEKIKMQELAKMKLNISDEEVEEGVALIASQNKIKKEDFIAMLEKRNINIETLRSQVRSQRAWIAIVNRKIRQNIEVSDADIDTFLSRIKNNIGNYEYLIAEIFLPFDKFNQEKDTSQLAYKLVGQLNAGSVPFSKLASQFSGAAGANKGGDMGWIQHGQLSEYLEKALIKMPKNSVSKPIRGIDGYHILLLRDKRLVSEENMPKEEDVRNIIGMERLERNARAYFYDLKSSSFIDVRK